MCNIFVVKYVAATYVSSNLRAHIQRPTPVAEWSYAMARIAHSSSVRIPARASEKVTINMCSSGGFRQALWFPSPFTTG